MHISESMIRYYLDTVTVGYFDVNDLPPVNVHGYEEYIQEMKLKAVKHGDLQDLRIALAYLLANKNIDLSNFNGGRYPFDDDEMREIIRNISETLFPGDKGPSDDELGSVELVQMPLEAWWLRRVS